MSNDDLGDHKPNDDLLPIEELVRLPLGELEDYADNLIGTISLEVSPSELAAISTALVSCLAQDEPTDPKHIALRHKMQSTFDKIMAFMGQNKEN